MARSALVSGCVAMLKRTCAEQTGERRVFRTGARAQGTRAHPVSVKHGGGAQQVDLTEGQLLLLPIHGHDQPTHSQFRFNPSPSQGIRQMFVFLSLLCFHLHTFLLVFLRFSFFVIFRFLDFNFDLRDTKRSKSRVSSSFKDRTEIPRSQVFVHF